MKLRVIKPLTYMSRQMRVGDIIEPVKERDIKILLAGKRAEKVREEVKIDPPPSAVAKKIAEITQAAPEMSELAQARADYRAEFDKPAFNGWDVDTLRAKIAERKMLKDIVKSDE